MRMRSPRFLRPLPDRAGEGGPCAGRSGTRKSSEAWAGARKSCDFRYAGRSGTHKSSEARTQGWEIAHLLCLLSVLCAVAHPETVRPSEVSVDWKEGHQIIVGFGGTMGWIHPHPDQRKEVFDLLFTKLGASVLRIRALGGEGDDERSLEPVNDNGDPDQFEWSRLPIKDTEGKNAIIIKAAQERGVKTVVAVTWSPPGWMKDTGRRAGGGELREGLLAEYAELWAAYVIGMRKEFGIGISHLSIQNEPDLTYYYPTCRFEPDFYAKAMGAVIARLRKEKLETKVLGPDTCRIYNMPGYVAAMERAKIHPRSPILTHLYDLSIPYQRVDRDAERWREAKALAVRHNRALWMMETANYLSYGVDKGSYDEAVVWAQKLHHALVAGDCEVVCYWSLFFDKRGEALIYCAESEDKNYEVTPKFYTSMNYFRFVRPGMVRSTAKCTSADILVSAYRSKEGAGDGRVIVAVNPTRNQHSVRLAALGKSNWSRHLTTEKKKCTDEGPVDTDRPLHLPPRSVTTLVGTKE